MSMKIIEMVNRRIMEQLEQGVIPWSMPWRKIGPPRNLISGKVYRGINLLLLSHHEFSSPHFLTFKQAKKLGGHISKGAKGFQVIFWGWVDRKDETDQEETKTGYPFLRTYTVFNLDQCVGIDTEAQIEETPFTPLEQAEQVLSGMPSPPGIVHAGDRACYRWLTDEVTLPPRERFFSPEEYYSTVFHELVHATGHGKRIGREGIETYDGFGSERYSKEELIAEMGASYLSAMSGIEDKTLDNSAAYIQGWMKALKNDKRLIMQASSAAQKAVEYIAEGSLSISETSKTEHAEAA